MVNIRPPFQTLFFALYNIKKPLTMEIHIQGKVLLLYVKRINLTDRPGFRHHPKSSNGSLPHSKCYFNKVSCLVQNTVLKKRSEGLGLVEHNNQGPDTQLYQPQPASIHPPLSVSLWSTNTSHITHITHPVCVIPGYRVLSTATGGWGEGQKGLIYYTGILLCYTHWMCDLGGNTSWWK